MSSPVITIDGPSGAGKGTLSQMLARHLGWQFLDSGAIYRLCGLACLKANIAFDDHVSVIACAQSLDIDFIVTDDGLQTLLDGEEVTAQLRTEEGGAAASQVASIPAVREALLQRQRAFAKSPGLVADGRDMGTVVFCDAALKFYLTASAEERAARRYKQLQQAGESVNLAAILADIQSRDERDMSRKVAPLKPADDAIEVESTDLSIDAVFNIMLENVHAKGLV
ncbi:Cytidylate kinase [BD1-7 clade bacterium]|uniref:Cytidylate kinase n=1 Tax=BD1-7 clade bacterium TaxID=2029982 RepID=A0A5S9PUG0_9GAMM|nr:Cytidylate kinase [BD1-7 clade bacterium]CAA0108252.1 Cytidylate kinase [BD1-7 clade bacterium]